MGAPATTAVPKRGDRRAVRGRIRLALVGVVMALAASMLFGVPGAIATDDQPILARQDNTATSRTIVRNTTEFPQRCDDVYFGDDGLIGCGEYGLRGIGTHGGVYGEGPIFGVSGIGTSWGVHGHSTSSDGVGVQGWNAQSGGTAVKGYSLGGSGVGVWGVQAGVGSAVYGEAQADGAGVFGDTTNGTGVQARSTNGIALNVLGKARFSETGIAVVAPTNSRVTVNNVRMTNSSFVLATPQGVMPGIWVRGVVKRSASSFAIYLNKAVPAGSNSLFIGWFVVN